MTKKIILISGDPNSINSEIIFKCWKKLSIQMRKKIYLVANYNLLETQFKKLNYKIKLKSVKNINNDIKSNKLKVLNIALNYKNPFNVSQNEASKFVVKSLNFSHKLALKKNILGIINCPINKNLLKNKMGVTEYLANKCKIKDNTEVMLIRNKSLSVAPITTHLDIKQVSKKIKVLTIIKKVKTINNWFKKMFNKKPKIAILGLNPHNAELRINSEERKIIIPAIKKLKKFGLKLTGPHVSDTFFINEYKSFDVVVGMFHDQVITPFKTIFKFDAINITLGLKYLRVSPDHGVAINLIGKKKADSTSLFKCINFINKFGK
jgi:4-hydroxy-L-threonine phosphate dehydrogenase PdxA